MPPPLSNTLESLCSDDYDVDNDDTDVARIEYLDMLFFESGCQIVCLEETRSGGPRVRIQETYGLFLLHLVLDARRVTIHVAMRAR